MKKLVTTLGVVALAASAQATTVSLSGGPAGLTFENSSGAVLSSSTGTIQVGSLSGGVFTQFAAGDLTPPSFGDSGVLAGKWLGNASDNSSDATAFNGQAIWFKVSFDDGAGAVGEAFFSGTNAVFPTNANGAGDTLVYSSVNLNTFDAALSTAGTGFAAGKAVVGVVPEPSVALLGALGLLGLVRRRR
jgi:hypothetical protein